jgi:hypothetical protein
MRSNCRANDRLEAPLRKRRYGSAATEAPLRKRRYGSAATEAPLRKRRYGNLTASISASPAGQEIFKPFPRREVRVSRKRVPGFHFRVREWAFRRPGPTAGRFLSAPGFPAAQRGGGLAGGASLGGAGEAVLAGGMSRLRVSRPLSTAGALPPAFSMTHS